MCVDGEDREKTKSSKRNRTHSTVHASRLPRSVFGEYGPPYVKESDIRCWSRVTTLPMGSTMVCAISRLLPPKHRSGTTIMAIKPRTANRDPVLSCRSCDPFPPQVLMMVDGLPLGRLFWRTRPRGTGGLSATFYLDNRTNALTQTSERHICHIEIPLLRCGRFLLQAARIVTAIFASIVPECTLVFICDAPSKGVG